MCSAFIAATWRRSPGRAFALDDSGDGERNKALSTFVNASAALHGLISMGLRLNEETDIFRAAHR